LKHFCTSRRRILRGLLIASAVAAVATAASQQPASAQSATKSGHHGARLHQSGSLRPSDAEKGRRSAEQRRAIREKLSTSAHLLRPSPRDSTEHANSGIASIYSGRQTASGEVMNPRELTAAHPTLPFGTRVTVINRSNGLSAVVRINDRGPFVRGRVIDLSPAAGRVLGVSGLARVSLIMAGYDEEAKRRPDHPPVKELNADENELAAE
jgi:rare lipoprotein A